MAGILVIFAWSVACDGMKNADSPAPDGEEFLQWHSYLLHTGGVMAREFSAIQKRQKTSLYLYTQRRIMALEEICGIWIII